MYDVNIPSSVFAACPDTRTRTEHSSLRCWGCIMSAKRDLRKESSKQLSLVNLSSFHIYKQYYLYINFEGPNVVVPTRGPEPGDKGEEGAGPLTWFA